jgi:trimethylamine---corrinoid protein Co-methyltransferase
MRPIFRLLSDSLIERILAEAREVLWRLGVEVHNPRVLSLLSDHGAKVERETQRVYLPDEIVDRAIASAPKGFKLYDVLGRETHDLSGSNVHFTPGSAAIHVLDGASGEIRKPSTRDCIEHFKVVSGLPNLHAASTAIVPADVHESVSDSYRLYLSLLYCEKPVVTGAFRAESFAVMKDFQLAVRGDEKALKEKPLTIFSCCPTSPLKWSEVTSENLVDCARWGIPTELISMPLSGFMAPVTLVGTLIQHTAETLSGLVIAQLASPGAPVLYGGSPASFDVRYETTPMGAVETQMVDCAYNEIGKYLHLPTQAYIALSDAKRLDAQAGLESSMGGTLAALAGINSVSGPGMLDFESCQSLEKLVLDHEICGLVLRLARGIEPREDFPSIPVFEELLREKHLLIAAHTRRHLRAEHYFPGPAIDRANLSRWREEGGFSLGERAFREVKRLIGSYVPSRLSDDVQRDLTGRMEAEARRTGMEALPSRDA